MNKQFKESYYQGYHEIFFEFPNLESNKLRELLVCAKKGETNAKNEIILAHMKHVFAYVDKHYNFNHPTEYQECISLATVALYDAIAGYQFNKGASFASYSDNWIRKAVLNYFDSKKPKISNVQEVNRLIKIENAYLQKYGDLPSKEQLSQMMGKTPEKIQKLMNEKMKREQNYTIDIDNEYCELFYPDKITTDELSHIEYNEKKVEARYDAALMRDILAQDKRIDADDLKLFDMMVMDAFGEAERFTTTRGAMVLGKTPQAVSARRTKIRNILKEYGYADALHDN